MKKKNNYYDCIVFECGKHGQPIHEVCEIRLKGLYSVCKFLETCDLVNYVVNVITPTGKNLDGRMLVDLWRYR